MAAKAWVGVAAVVALAAASARAGVVQEVRSLARGGSLEQARSVIDAARKRGLAAPEELDALSQLARGELQAGHFEAALTEARHVHARALLELAHRPLDAEPHLPLALGAAIEVEAQATAAKGERGSAVARLRTELSLYGKTSLGARLNKNLHVLSLEGEVPPQLEAEPHLGPPVPQLSAPGGKPTLLFFWAHWCPDCKQTARVLGRLREAGALRGVTLIAPTQLYGTVGGGAEATPEQELSYVSEVWRSAYAGLGDAPVPLSAANFAAWGASTTPTLVLIDRRGRVALYHPGAMTEAELQPILAKLLR
jgi:thiol-disulfide isomerase/thioredoxin